LDCTRERQVPIAANVRMARARTLIRVIAKSAKVALTPRLAARNALVAKLESFQRGEANDVMFVRSGKSQMVLKTDARYVILDPLQPLGVPIVLHASLEHM